jgi:transcriptional regulator with XRE-family HTH domain
MTPFKRKRLSCGLTRKQVADRIGASVDTIGKWDRDDAAPSPKFYPKLAAAFGMTAEAVTHLFDAEPATAE